MRNVFIACVALLFITTSCNMKQKADLILINGKIYTVDSTFKIVSAIAVKDGKIIDMGADDYILNNYRASHYEDAQGNAVFPGFNDAHCHFIGLGRSLNVADLRNTTSFEEIIEKLKEFDKANNPQVLVGEGWDQNLWQIKEFPDNSLLNKAFPGKPVILKRIDYHAVIVNEAAINKLGLKPNDGSYPIAEAVTKGDKFTGVFLETTADKFKGIVPEPGDTEMEQIIKLAQDECFKFGLTSVSDADVSFMNATALINSNNSGLLKIRADVWLSATAENIQNFPKPVTSGNIRIGTIKMYLDGALGSRGALLIAPYSDKPEAKGIYVGTPEDFEKYCKWAYDNNFQVAVHCIGDGANREALRVFGNLLKDKNDRRWRIEHAQIVDPNDFALFGKYSIIPSIQPTHATSDMIWAKERLGERLVNAYAYKQLLSQNGWLPSGTDFPIEKVNPIYTFYAAVFRKNLDAQPDGGFQMENALTREEALRSMTIWAAKASFEESIKGSLEKGKYADFVILDKDLMTAEEYEILRTKVLKTFVGGELVFSRK